MANVSVSLKDLCGLVGKKIPQRELADALMFAKSEVESINGDSVVVEVKDSNRPDLLSTEGIAREIRSRLTSERGVPKYRVRSSGVSLIVDKSVLPVRPCIAAAIVRNVKVTEEFLVQMVQLQEKVCLTFGRKRKEAAIGLYDWGKLKPPMHYTAYRPREKRFIPLEYKVEMDLEEILLEHPKGKEFAQLLQGQKMYPILEDDRRAVASMPPIINSQLTGKVSEKTQEVLVEVTGYSQETVNTALNVMVSALAERGFDVYSVRVKYPNKAVVTPDFTPKKITVNARDVNDFSGLQLGEKEIIELLRKARYDVKQSGGRLQCNYPAYRQDIMHPVDVIEDALVSYGYNKIKPLPVRIATGGKERQETALAEAVREACIGLGLQEVLTYTMTSKQKQAAMVGLDTEKEQFVEIANPVSENYVVFRKQLFPELLDFLAANKHVQYPQNIFEIGKTLRLDGASETGVRECNTLCVALCGKGAEFTAIKSILGAVASAMGWEYGLLETANSALADGRGALVKIAGKEGILGEIKKEVLQNFGLGMPVALLEIEI
ncbi:MAG: phenylalanine--tRNA ligase subunit beta [Candidatus Diapherotrites archaeon]|nr:phenylalanine--tRNA ligase subunit beta [Candidatus Diapherotrites archaeon]